MTNVVQAKSALPIAGSLAWSFTNPSVAGHLLLAVIGYNDTAFPTGKPGIPTGWQLYSEFDHSGANDALGVFYRYSTGDTGATFTSGGDFNSGILLELTGMAASAPFSVALAGGGPNGSNSIVTPPAVPVVNGSIAIAAYSDDVGAAVSTFSTGWTAYEAPGNYHGSSVAVRNLPTSDNSPVSCIFDSNANFGAYSSITLLLSPASVPSTPYTLTAKVTDSATGLFSSATGAFTVNGNTTPPPPPVSIVTANLAAGALSTPYLATLAATGGTAPYTWAVIGTLPTGLSLSGTTGVLSGTPTVAGTYAFTVHVSDVNGQAATAMFSIVVSGAPISTQTFPSGGRYTSPVADPNLAIKGESVLPYVDTNVWGPVAGETMTLEVFSVRNWSVKANANNPGGAVTCFPNTGAYPTVVPWQNGALTRLTSGWNETLPKSPSIIASACYDNWFDNTMVGPTGSAINEVMFHFDFSNRGAGPWRATAVPFGGYTVNGVAIPLTHWNLAAIGTAAYWNLVDSSGNITSLPQGSVDALAMFKWLVTNGYLSTTCNLAGFSLGYEICSTGGTDQEFVYSDMWWSGA